MVGHNRRRSVQKMSGGDQWQIVLFLCLQFSTQVQSGFEKTCSSDTESAGPHYQGICGSMIPDTLHLLCGGSYNMPFKRDARSKFQDLDHRLSPLAGVIIGKREAFSYLSADHSRTKRNTYTGIVCECCYHQCDIYELLQYCGYRRKRNSGLPKLPYIKVQSRKADLPSLPYVKTESRQFEKELKLLDEK